MRAHSRRRIAIVAATMAVAAGLVAGSATIANAADEGPTVSGGSLILRSSTPPKGTVSPQATAPCCSGGTFTVSSKSTGSNITNTFSSRILIANAYTYAKVLSGTTTSTWNGSGTGNVTIKDHFWATGLAVSVSAPAGASFSLAQASADYTGGANGVKKSSNIYSGLEFSGPLFTVNQNTTSSWRVGGNTYHLTTN